MKVKTADLIGPALDWAVAKAKGFNVEPWFKEKRGWLRDNRFSKDWSLAGPIIDRAGIQWAQVGGEMEAWSGFDYLEWRRNWELPPQLPQGAGFGTGPTVLSATMRCFVASQLGDEVDIPEELLK